MRYRTIVLIDLYYGLIDLYSSTRCDSLRRLSHRGLFYNFPFTSKHRNAVSRARHRRRVAYNGKERKVHKIYIKKVISLWLYI